MLAGHHSPLSPLTPDHSNVATFLHARHSQAQPPGARLPGSELLWLTPEHFYIILPAMLDIAKGSSLSILYWILNTFNKYFLSFEHFPCDTRNWDIQQKVRSWWLESELRDIVSRVTWTEWREWGCTLRYTDTLSSSSPAQRERSAQTRPYLSFPDLGSNNNCLKNEIVDLIDTRIIDILT